MKNSFRVRNPQTGETIPYPGYTNDAVAALCGRCDHDCRGCMLQIEPMEEPLTENLAGQLAIAEGEALRYGSLLRIITEVATDLRTDDAQKVNGICAVISDLTCPENAIECDPLGPQILSTIESFVDGRAVRTYHLTLCSGQLDPYAGEPYRGHEGVTKANAKQTREREIYTKDPADYTDYLIVTPAVFHAEVARRQALADRFFVYKETR